MAKYNKSENHYIQGKTAWFRPKVPNKWNKWSAQVHPNQEGLELIRELQAQGLKNQLKKDDDGYFLNISRPVTKETATGKILSFEPVKVFDKDGNPFDGNVGNGSDVTFKVEVYEHGTPGGGKAKAMRWVSSRIDNLIPFNSESDLAEHEKDPAVMDQPKQQELF